MARRTVNEPEVAGNDSFLDITTNIVGILIILVMVVGERAKTAPIDLPPPEPSAELVAARSEARSLEGEVHEIANQMAIVQSELKAKTFERGQLSTLIMAVERELDGRRAALDEKAQREFNLDRKLAQAQSELSRLEAERLAAEQAAEPSTIEVESYPTPLGRTVHGDETHLRLQDGRLTVLPMERLMDRMLDKLRDVNRDPHYEPQIMGTLGPIEGFRLRYVINRVIRPINQDAVQGIQTSLAYAELVPISQNLGEPIEVALQPGSRFHQTIERFSPQTCTVTVWTYPDSFGEFRKLKKQLYDRGYSVAARPMPAGLLIGFSPDGSRSSAQ